MNAHSVLASTLFSDSPFRLALGLLPVVVFLLLTRIIAAFRPPGPGRLRDSLLIATIFCGLWFVIGTELLSLFRAISFWPILLWWLLPASALLLIAASGKPPGDTLPTHNTPLLALPRPLHWTIAVPIALTAAILLLCGIVAALSPPNIPDTTIYHMARQLHWIQQQSLAHYPTPQFMQLAMPPMAEFASLHLMILSGDDAYASLTQWAALVLAALAASLIARELGGAPLAQSMAALFVVANPMTWGQATNPKNDVITALWLLIAALWIVRTMRDNHCGPSRWLMIGSAAGLAAATKLTGTMFVLPLLAALALWLILHRRKWIDRPHNGRLVILPLAGTVLAITLALSAGYLTRNLITFKTLHGSNGITHDGRRHNNETRAPGAIASVVIRNLALHTGTPSPTLNKTIERTVQSLHHRLGRDINDPRTTIYEDFMIRYIPQSDSVAGAPVHLLLTALLLIIFPLRVLMRCIRPAASRSDLAPALPHAAQPIPPPALAITPTAFLLCAVLAAFLLFCIILKWQPWHSRLHIGLFALLAPLTAVILCRGRGFGAIIICILLLIPLIPAIRWNDRRELAVVLTTPRDDLRVPPRHAMAELIAFLQQTRPESIGLAVWPSEYTIHRHILRELDYTPIIFDPRFPTDRHLGQPWPTPEVIIANVSTWDRFQHMASGEMFYQVRRARQFRILTTKETAERLRHQGLIE